MDYRKHEGIIERLEVWLGMRAAPKPPPAQPAPTTSAAAPAAPKAPKAEPRVQEAADRAEVETLKKEVWRLRDKLDQLSIWLAEKPQPKAEERPIQTRIWPLPETIEYRPKGVRPEPLRPPRQIVDPDADLTGDPAFALRREEFEQWLVRRKEALESKFQAREDELKKAFDAKVKERVEARMAKEDANGRVYTQAQFMSIWKCLHPDSRKSATDKALSTAFRLLEAGRKRLAYVMDEKGKKKPFTPPAPAPETPREGGPSAGALS